MFRRLFAIETAALQSHADDVASHHDHLVHPVGESLRDMARFVSTPSCYGMWSTRAAG